MPAVSESKYIVFAGWDDVPHLDAKTKRELLASTPAWQRDARSKGIPALGSGAVFPVPEDDILMDPVPIQDHWVHIGGMDFGWDHPWAGVHCVWDRDTDVFMVTKEHRQQHLTPIRAKEALKAWDLGWLPWAWPHDGTQTEKGSGEDLRNQYNAAGFRMLEEHSTFSEFEGGGYSFEAGILEMLNRMETGRFKVWRTCPSWIEEFRLYHRKDGLVVKERDDTISASRYALMMRRYAVRRPSSRPTKLNISKNWRAG